MNLGTATRVAAVIGLPIDHSRSPALHNAAYRARGIDAVYLAFAVRPGSVAAAVEGAATLGFLGLNVTVPHKRAVLELCHDLDEDARLVGAVNTVVFDGGKLRGANTDVEGFGRSLDENLGRAATRAVVLGAGGAARAVLAALAQRGVGGAVVGRDLERARELLSLGAVEAVPWTETSLRHVLAGADLVVDATSAGLSADDEARAPCRVPLEAVDDSALIMSLVYHREPSLLAAARARGLRTLDGAGMLVHQAARAFTLMTGEPAPLGAMWEAFRQSVRTDET
jgi:shikimate dehydrogenase